MDVVAGFFGTMFIFILLTLVLRTALRRMMRDTKKAETIAYVIAMVLTIMVAWIVYDRVAVILAIIYIGGGVAGDCLDKWNASDVPKI